MARLTEIAYRLPHADGSFLTHLRTLLGGVAPLSAAPGRLTLTPAAPVGALPVTVFETAAVDVAQVRFTTSDGDAYALESPPGPSGGGVAFGDLAARLAAHVEAVDHTGVNLPAASSAQLWRQTVDRIAGSSAMYRYPTGEPWPFVLPATAAELDGAITAFVAGREPRFELVRDDWLAEPLWQFALRTDLSRAALERMFPEPDGTAFPGLGEVFRAVTVRGRPLVRFDLYYRGDGAPDDWETGEWLVTAGGRIGA
ncbi:hypothetical protein [Dactylosporangium matsuzakiense]|uniref:Uncharacterized protein n=1 Tax=Dactylosporangium matsuzakiense TaxID=53360 RepID=A0A9W6NRW9_9ACTN|nr:hypothetical protein [Dactylosporangium matsuzakiense]UWZ49007.1 hypothetical protein Dmats_23005 [Dactylosporangium matsuzakiense]GLL07735.1 hypothetical protein GCM10017581_094920 [Dactylosporangium matsuzakiense]